MDNIKTIKKSVTRERLPNARGTRARTKLVYVISTIKNTGPNRVLEAMVAAINTDEFEVFVVSMLKNGNDKSAIKRMRSYGAACISLNLESKLSIVTSGTQQLAKLVADISPDIVHSHGILPDFAVSGIKSSVHTVSTVHSNLDEDYLFSFGKVRGYLFSRWHIGVLRKFDKVVFCSRSLLEAADSRFARGCFVRNGISPERAKVQGLRKTLGIRQTDIVFVYVGKLSEGKNILALLENFSNSRSRNEHLIVVGDGPLRSECAQYASDNIHIVGFRNDAVKYLAISDIYVSASKSEGMSISIIEALSNGLYLLLSDIPSHREVATIEKAMPVSELFAADNFAAAKRKLIAKMNGKGAPRRYHQKYLSGAVMTAEYEHLYEGIIG